MKLIDVYLGRHGKKRYDVFKETGLSQQTLASANGKPAAALTGRILQAIGRTVGETPGRVLDEMLMIEQEGLVMTVTTKEELLEALKRAADRIDVQGGLRTEVLRLAKKNFMASYTGVTPGVDLHDGAGNALRADRGKRDQAGGMVLHGRGRGGEGEPRNLRADAPL